MEVTGGESSMMRLGDVVVSKCGGGGAGPLSHDLTGIPSTSEFRIRHNDDRHYVFLSTSSASR